MKKFTKIAIGFVLTTCAMVSTSAYAEVSYNVGWASEYYYRGLLQKNSSGSAGVDFEEGGFYAGGWTADVGDGLEIDGYFGYGFETEEGFSASLGFTGYYYTGNFDDTYEEINVGLGYGMLSLGYSVGEWDGFGTPEEYDVFEISIENDAGFYGTFGTLGDQFSGEWFEFGYGATISDIDFGIAAIFSSDDYDNGEYDTAGNTDASSALIFSVGLSF